jgi:hypothetical protein
MITQKGQFYDMVFTIIRFETNFKYQDTVQKTKFVNSAPCLHNDKSNTKNCHYQNQPLSNNEKL